MQHELNRLTEAQEALRLIEVSAYGKVYRNRQQPTGAYRLLRAAQRKADQEIRWLRGDMKSTLDKILGA